MTSSGPVFVVTATADGDLVATTSEVRLRGVEWRWTPGTGAVEYGLAGHPVGIVNVWNYAAGTCGLPPTEEALAAHLEELYADPEAVAAVRSEVAHGA